MSPHIYKVVNAMVHAMVRVTPTRPKLRYAVGWDNKFFWTLSLLPSEIQGLMVPPAPTGPCLFQPLSTCHFHLFQTSKVLHVIVLKFKNILYICKSLFFNCNRCTLGARGSSRALISLIGIYMPFVTPTSDKSMQQENLWHTGHCKFVLYQYSSACIFMIVFHFYSHCLLAPFFHLLLIIVSTADARNIEWTLQVKNLNLKTKLLFFKVAD